MLSKTIKSEIKRLSEEESIDSSILEQFANFIVINNNETGQANKGSRKKPLKMAEIKIST